MRGRLLCSVLCLTAWLAAGAAAGQPSLEYDIKAAFILNFARYVGWPAERQSPPLQICVLTPNPCGDRLQSVVSGERWQGGEIQVHAVDDMRAATRCHLLYVPAVSADRFARGISAISGLPVLTIGEHDGFLAQGGNIHLFVEENRVRFSINQKTADAVGLHISSRLLRLARNVVVPGAAP